MNLVNDTGILDQSKVNLLISQKEAFVVFFPVRELPKSADLDLKVETELRRVVLPQEKATIVINRVVNGENKTPNICVGLPILRI